jgi:hypothetical protein
MNEDNTNNNTEAKTLTKEEVAIINAAFKLHEVVILHRIYKRGIRSRHLFTKGAYEAARKALSGLSYPEPGIDPVLVVGCFAKQHDVTKAAILSAIEQAEKAKREMWERIREIELSEAELKALSDEAPIFRIYRGVVTLDRAIKELSHPDLVSKIATIVWKLAERVRQVENRSAGADTGREAA